MRVGVIIIGNEILSGSTRDLNIHELASRLFAWGARLEEVAIIPDVVETIADRVRTFSARFDLVITSGGIGPTHDDMTYEGIAVGLGVELVSDPRLEAIARQRHGDQVSPAALKMTVVPAGSQLLEGGPFLWPPVMSRNVVALPGIPDLLAGNLPLLRPLVEGPPFVVTQIRCYCREVQLARAAHEASKVAGVEVGSYPRIFAQPPYVVIRITGSDAHSVDQAVARFHSLLPTGTKTERE